MSRQYDSPLRGDQQEQTRVRILEAVRDELEMVRPDELSFAAIATRAKVSERTVYRHFESKEALMDAFWTWWIAGPFGVPTDDAMEVDQLPQYVRVLYAAYEKHEHLSRGLIMSKVGRDVRNRSRSGRRKAVDTSLDAVTKKLSADHRKLVVSVFQMLHSVETWHTLRERKLTTEEAADAVVWISRLLIDELRHSPKTLETR
jgi:AcrR family transcriptional regulator